MARLLTEFRDHQGRDWPDDASFLESVLRLMADPDTEFLLAGEPADGVCQLRYRFGVWYAAHDCLIEDVFVRERARGRRAGTGAGFPPPSSRHGNVAAAGWSWTPARATPPRWRSTDRSDSRAARPGDRDLFLRHRF